MKTLNIIMLTFVLCLVGGYSIAIVSAYFLGQAGALVALPVSMIFGFNSRKIVEKLLGQTLEDAIKEDSKSE